MRTDPDGVREQVDLSNVDVADVLQALSDPARLAIVRMLDENGDVPCGRFDLGLARSTMTHHLNVLRESGLVSQLPVGTTRLNRLRRNEFDEHFPGLLTSVLGALADGDDIARRTKPK